MRKTIDISGQKFGKLTVLKFSHIGGHNSIWECLCDCGNTTFVVGYNLKNRHTKSCGCERANALRKSATKHGLHKSRFYTIWCQIKQRCEYPKHKAYKNYGGKGIKNFWRYFEDFRKDMYRTYLTHVKKFSEKNTTIDRIDNKFHYCKENCRWATWKIQANNKSFPPKTVSYKRNSRKFSCPYCKVGTDVSHKLGCPEIKRLESGQRISRYSVHWIE